MWQMLRTKKDVDRNETVEDNVIIDRVTFSTTTQYAELKGKGTWV